MKPRVALAAALVAPFATALTGPVAPARAVTVCQGQPVTIQATTTTVVGTEGDDVIATTYPYTTVTALGGNDLICTPFSAVVYPGAGNDSVVSTANTDLDRTEVYLTGGTDTYVGARGSSYVVVENLDSFTVDMGTSYGTLEIRPHAAMAHHATAVLNGGRVLALGEHSTRVNLIDQWVRVDGQSDVVTSGLRNATATACKVRMDGDAANNVLEAFGHDIVVSGGGGRDRLARVGNGFDLDLPPCDRYRSVFRGGGGPDRLSGRLGDDVLIGGRGRDVADGAGGFDTCRAEVRRNCEQ